MGIWRVLAPVIAVLLAVGCAGKSPTPVLTATPDIEATVQAAVAAALPTATPTPTPDIDATVEARIGVALAAIPTPTPVPTDTPTPTPVPTDTPTPTPVPTDTPTPTPVPTDTPTPTPVPTATPTPTPVPTDTPTPTSVPTATPTPTPVPTDTPTPTPVPTDTPTPTPQPTPTPVPTPTKDPASSLSAMVKQARSAVVRIQTSSGSGSGVIFETQGQTGYVITNHHVVEGEVRVSVIVNDSTTYRGSVLGTDSTRDLAVVSICCGSFPGPALWQRRNPTARRRSGGHRIPIGVGGRGHHNSGHRLRAALRFSAPQRRDPDRCSHQSRQQWWANALYVGRNPGHQHLPL